MGFIAGYSVCNEVRFIAVIQWVTIHYKVIAWYSVGKEAGFIAGYSVGNEAGFIAWVFSEVQRPLG